LYGSDERLLTYFNASYINSLVRLDPTTASKPFIASMSPSQHSVAHFWQMIWDNAVKLIIMLCPLKGVKQEESNAYWTAEL